MDPLVSGGEPQKSPVANPWELGATPGGVERIRGSWGSGLGPRAGPLCPLESRPAVKKAACIHGAHSHVSPLRK